MQLQIYKISFIYFFIEKSDNFSKRTNVGKLNESLPEKVWITSDACVASAPFGKNDELLFSCTEESLPKRGPNTPVSTNQKMTINMAKA